VNPPNLKEQPLLKVRSLHFGWQLKQPPLLNIDALDLSRGESLFIYGPSGCGKSSLLGLLGGVLSPQHGSVSVLGQNFSAMRGQQRDRFRVDHSGFIFQQFNLIPYLDVIDNVLLPCRFSQRRATRASASDGSPVRSAMRLLEALGLEATQAGRKTVDLSVGQQQRVAAARALIGSPELIIADEPTSALDGDAQHAFLSLLFGECARVASTLVFVSHDRSLAQRFDRHIDLPALSRP
jgi:putative ABC transport system ATP-binding protein